MGWGMVALILIENILTSVECILTIAEIVDEPSSQAIVNGGGNIYSYCVFTSNC